MKSDLVVSRVESFYKSLGEKLKVFSGLCEGCGKCCDLESYGHRVFVTPVEVMYLKSKLGDGGLKKMVNGTCPYLVEGKCSIHEYRFLPCRVFYCKGDAEEQGRISEWAIRELKNLCVELGVGYRYMDLHTALDSSDEFCGD